MLRSLKLKNINKYQIWVWLLFFSFAYEKPVLIISSLDKVNPRLFDVVLALGIFLTLNKPIPPKNVIFRKWAILIFWFSIVTILGVMFFSFPGKIQNFMLYFLFDYIKGLLMVWTFLRIPRKYYTLQTIINAIIFGGFFVASYCVWEFITGVSELIVTGDNTIIKPAGVVWGPYIGSYFEIAVYVPLAACISFIMALKSYGREKLFRLLLTIFISWPAFFTGSRTAIFLLVFSFLIIVLYSFKKSFWMILMAGFILVGTIIFTERLNFLFDINQNETLGRLEKLESDTKGNSITSRVLLFMDYNLNGYNQEEAIPFIGGGFNVAPRYGKYRVGFGVHNIYLYPFEQSGFIGVILFLIFVYISIKILRKGLRKLNKKETAYWFVLGVYAYFIISLLIGISGHTFWRGFTTYNFNTLRILLLVTASILIMDNYNLIKKEN